MMRMSAAIFRTNCNQETFSGRVNKPTIRGQKRQLGNVLSAASRIGAVGWSSWTKGGSSRISVLCHQLWPGRALDLRWEDCSPPLVPSLVLDLVALAASVSRPAGVV